MRSCCLNIISKSPNPGNTEDPQPSQYHRGTIHDNGWESKFVGLRYTALDGMSMSTEEELDKLMELDWENLSKIFSQRELAYMDFTSVFEMMSQTDDQRTTVAVCVDRLLEQTNLSQVT